MFGQTGPKVGSFDAGYGSSHMARLVGIRLLVFTSGIPFYHDIAVTILLRDFD